MRTHSSQVRESCHLALERIARGLSSRRLSAVIMPPWAPFTNMPMPPMSASSWSHSGPTRSGLEQADAVAEHFRVDGVIDQRDRSACPRG